ncbi:MAG TPA: hypothetical protein VFY21_06890 [Xanthobacteraceae bacterium]|nr:hypothetical protein [Xanthobacteraceae bacterium]
MDKVADIIDVWPSVAEFGRDLGVPYTTAFSWKDRGAIPGEHWLAIVRAARHRGHPEISVDLLARLHAREPIPAEPAGFAEARTGMSTPGKAEAAKNGTGHFTRFKHLRRDHYKSAEEIEEYIRALRDEWSHR